MRATVSKMKSKISFLLLLTKKNSFDKKNKTEGNPF